jgi:ECF transporter S component (folate family)
MVLAKDFWSSSANNLKSVKYLAIMAIFIALKTIMSGIYIPVAENLRIGISFTVVALEASIIGPVAGMLSGAITDIVGFMMFPSGPFFAGYTLSAVVNLLLYSLFLYRQKITILKLFMAKFSVSLISNVMLGSLWSAMLYSKGYIYYLTNSVIKNTILLPIEVIVLVLIFNLMIPILEKRKLITPQDPLPIKWK